MKQMMLDMMVMMMPYMKPVVYVGAGLLAVAIIMLVIKLISGSGAGLARIAATGLVAIGLFLLACQGAGMLLGAAPSINFGDFDKGEFNLYPFWQIGLALFVPGVIVRMMTQSREI